MTKSPLPYQHILVAIDLSDNTEHIVKRAQDIAQASNATLSLIHVMAHTPMAYGGEFSIPIDAELEAALTQEAQTQLKRLAKKYGIPISSAFLKEGSVKTAVTCLAREIQADLIVVGSHGHHGLSALIGSQANAILHAAECDVWMVYINHSS